MKVLASRLTGKALNYAAGLADGYEPEWLNRNPDAIPDYCGSGLHFLRVLKENEIDVFRMPEGAPGWTARGSKPNVSRSAFVFFNQRGNNPCEAVMRCFVHMRVGAEVEIPDKFL
jgi:hypothetical protein